MLLHTCAEAIHSWLVFIIYHVSIYCYTGVPGLQPSGLLWFGIIVNPVPPNYCMYPHTKFPTESCTPVHNSLLDPVRGYNIRSARVLYMHAHTKTNLKKYEWYIVTTAYYCVHLLNTYLCTS